MRKIPFGEHSGAQVVGLVGYGGKRLPALGEETPRELVEVVRDCTNPDWRVRPNFVAVAGRLARLADFSFFDVEESLDAFFSFYSK